MSGERVTARYHVPRSQVWEGSRGRQQGCVHLYVGDSSRPLCGRRAWYARLAEEGERPCPRCQAKAERLNIKWSSATTADVGHGDVVSGGLQPDHPKSASPGASA